MDHEKVVAGFIGAGGIARSHAYSLSSLKYYYSDVPEIVPEAVCSFSEASRTRFADHYGFGRSCDLNAFLEDKNINTVFILGPNSVHCEHLKAAVEMLSVKRIYLEKPVCSSRDEEKTIGELAAGHPGITIQVGFQYLYSPSVREALTFWRSGKLGKPLHFDIRYYHGDYLNKDYRDKRKSRLTPSPDGGAMADLGSHGISLLIAFLGDNLHITSAVQSGMYDDVPEGSDLFSLISLYEKSTGAAGTLAASRISHGTGDSLSMELFAERGALRYSSVNADFYEYYTVESGTWNRKYIGSAYSPVTSFPSGHVTAGWLRAMVHAHYVFLKGGQGETIVPDITHGLAVQRLVSETTEHLREFRTLRSRL